MRAPIEAPSHPHRTEVPEPARCHGRRAALALAAVLAAGVLAACAAAPPPAATDPVLQPLGHGLWLLPGRFPRDRQPDGNSVVIEAPSGLAVVDTGRHAEHAQALLDFAARQGRPIAAVANTHWHLDHLGGNARLRERFARLDAVAAPAVDQAITQQFPGFRRDLEGMLADPATPPDVLQMVRVDIALYDRAAALRPTRAFDRADAPLVLAGRTLRAGVVRAASDGDLWLFDPPSRVLMLGDLVTLPAPFLDTACPATWREALGTVQALPFERAVPGHGPVLDRDGFGRWRRAFEALLDCAATDRAPRVCSAAWVADLGPLLAPQDHAAAHGMIAHYFAQRLRSPDRDSHCGRR